MIGLFFSSLLTIIFISNLTKLISMVKEVLSDKVEVNSYVDNDGTKVYSSIYYYNVDNITYICKSAYSFSTNPGNDNKKIYYNSSSPSSCMSEFSKKSNYS